ncbi:MAG TPA: hypothetical protein VHQ41_00390 [Patescibacteria group bacterium]|jgi:hypothetical protein|nr:hypothetical protein [Patescibacteria group bacterium]
MSSAQLTTLGSIASTLWYIFIHGGWVVFVILTIWILFQIYLNEIQTNYKNSLEWVVYEIKPPKENLASFYNAEQIFIQLHQLFDNWTFQEKYIEGRLVFWLSLEIVSLGGKISYVIRVPKKQKELVEAAFYANYPHIEMNEIEDYLENFEYDPDNDKYDLFGAEMILTQKEVIPIRTYREFISLKGPDASEKVVDPLSPLLEVFTRLSPKEFYAMQIVIKPVGDDSWRKDAEAEVTKLQGEKDFHQIDDITKLRIASIKSKLGKPGFKTKVRLLHMGTTGDFNKDAKKLVLSPFKVFNSANFNSFKAAFAPKLDYRISPTLEAPFIKYFVRKRKIEIFKAFKGRSTWIGMPMSLLNAEELATLFHFPITADQVNASVETVDIKKIQPPSNLPI